jgi:superfamily II DNA helicase RecQ
MKDQVRWLKANGIACTLTVVKFYEEQKTHIQGSDKCVLKIVYVAPEVYPISILFLNSITVSLIAIDALLYFLLGT